MGAFFSSSILMTGLRKMGPGIDRNGKEWRSAYRDQGGWVLDPAPWFSARVRVGRQPRLTSQVATGRQAPDPGRLERHQDLGKEGFQEDDGAEGLGPQQVLDP